MSDTNSNNSNNNNNQEEEDVSPRELIDTIEKLEYALIQLIEITSDGIESVADKKEEYKNITTAYYSLLQVRHLPPSFTLLIMFFYVENI
jgi:hypothetical protein